MKYISTIISCIFFLIVLKPLEVNAVNSWETSTEIHDARELDSKTVERLIAVVAPRYGLTKAEALYHYGKGDLTITELEENEVYAVEFEGILELLIEEGNG